MTVLIKPSSYACNLKCSYCFYCDEVETREDKSISFMNNETVDSIIREIDAYAKPNDEINIMFQGGEPLLAGPDFYRNFIKKAKILEEHGHEVLFDIQTNGTLLSDEYCEIFKDNDFLVGVSLDGPKELHNKNRGDTFDQVMKGIELLGKYGIFFTILSVITNDTDANEYFKFCKENNFNSVQPIYCLDSLDDNKKQNRLDVKHIVRFKKRLFNKWIEDIENEDCLCVREFENLASFLVDGEFEQCGFDGKCRPQLVIESDGSCYPCDFYCIDKYKCCNINSSTIKEMLLSKQMKDFMNYNPPISDLCNGCEFNGICFGGCKRYRSLFSSEKGYCPYKDFFMHASEKLALKGYFDE